MLGTQGGYSIRPKFLELAVFKDCETFSCLHREGLPIDYSKSVSTS